MGKTQSREKALSRNILMQESGQLNFIKGEGDFLEQSELGFGIFFADIPTSR
jgi:hypothetical protein